MKIYECEACGETFRDPRVKEWDESREDGWYEHFCQIVCPECGEDCIFEIKEEC